MNLSIIIPLYNEESTILLVIDNLNKIKFPDFVKNIEIVVVDDCSTDNSCNLVEETAKTNTKIKLIKHETNKGKGYAVRTGFHHGEGDVFLIQDADLELSPSDIPRMLETMHELDIGFVNGSRYLAGISRPLSSYKRYLANRFFTFLTSILINVKLTDMACGYKLISKSLINHIKLKENRFGFEAEIILKALRIKRNNIAEVPVQYFPRNEGEGKKLRSTDALKILWTITKYGLLKLN